MNHRIPDALPSGGTACQGALLLEVFPAPAVPANTYLDLLGGQHVKVVVQGTVLHRLQINVHLHMHRTHAGGYALDSHVGTPCAGHPNLTGTLHLQFKSTAAQWRLLVPGPPLLATHRHGRVAYLVCVVGQQAESVHV